MEIRRRHILGRRAGMLPVAFALLFATPALAQDTGGLEAKPGSLDVRPVAMTKHALRIAGDVGAEYAGRTVRVDRLRGKKWEPIATAVSDAGGYFTARWVADAPGRWELRATVVRDPGVANAASAPDLAARVSVFAPATASWYGPGFFNRRTACGITLTRRTIGVAHKKLPCGTKVEVLYQGRTLVVPVIDRGPFIPGRQWDLTQAAAETLGVTEVTRVGVLRAG